MNRYPIAFLKIDRNVAVSSCRLAASSFESFNEDAAVNCGVISLEF
jgi:hypothetical protein